MLQVDRILPDAAAPATTGDWCNPANYHWMAALPRTAWAWEFLRRNPKYGSDYASHLAGHPTDNEPDHLSALVWGLLRFENPMTDARSASVFWQMKTCRDVLPLAAAKMRPGTAVETLNLSNLQCRTEVYAGNTHHTR